MKLKFFIIIKISLMFCFSGYAVNDTSLASLPPTRNFPDFADIVEPLLPAVVNISTIQYPQKQNKQSFKKHYKEENPLDLFNEFLEKFGGLPPQQFEDSFADRKIVSLGSGFIIDPKGYIVTNHHVINDADEINIKLFDDTELTAKVIGSDPRTDLALLKVEYSKELPYVKFGDSNIIRPGNWVIAVGNPYRLGGTVTAGIVSTKAREIDVLANGIVDECIQTDASLNPGNSGGPLFNIRGEVIGVNRAIQVSTPAGGNVGIGFAIPSAMAENVIEQLKLHGKVSRGMLSIRIQAVSEEIAESLNMKTPYGALVVEVLKDGGGEKAGLQVGDIVIEYNGIEIKSYNKLPRLVAETKIGTNAKLVVLRNGKRVELNTIIKEGEIKDPATNSKIKKEDKLNLHDGALKKHGVTFINITPEARKEYALSNSATGIIVHKAEHTSSWMRKGLLKGDLITSVNQQPIKDIKEFEAAYDQAVKDKRKHILLLVKRQDITLFVPVPISEEISKSKKKP